MTLRHLLRNDEIFHSSPRCTVEWIFVRTFRVQWGFRQTFFTPLYRAFPVSSQLLALNMLFMQCCLICFLCMCQLMYTVFKNSDIRDDLYVLNNNFVEIIFHNIMTNVCIHYKQCTICYCLTFQTCSKTVNSFQRLKNKKNQPCFANLESRTAQWLGSTCWNTLKFDSHSYRFTWKIVALSANCLLICCGMWQVRCQPPTYHVMR